MYQPPCRVYGLNQVLEEVARFKRFVDFIQATGGEPLLQINALLELFKAAIVNVGLKTSLNSNLTLYDNFRRLVEEDVVNHVATDLKIPFRETVGVSNKLVEAYWGNYLASLKLVKEYSVELELRIPVLRGLVMENYEVELNMLKILESIDKLKIIIQPVKGEPLVEPRCREWCLHRCNPEREELERVKNWFMDRGFNEVYIRN